MLRQTDGISFKQSPFKRSVQKRSLEEVKQGHEEQQGSMGSKSGEQKTSELFGGSTRLVYGERNQAVHTAGAC